MADELVFLIGSLFHDMRLMMTADGIDFIDDGFVDEHDADDGSVTCVPVPSAVKYRPKFLWSLREFRRVCSTILNTSDSTFDERRADSMGIVGSSVNELSIDAATSGIRAGESRDVCDVDERLGSD